MYTKKDPTYLDAYEGAREEAAIWKRRALEAEEQLRITKAAHDESIIQRDLLVAALDNETLLARRAEAQVKQLKTSPTKPVLVLQGGALRADGKFWYSADTIIQIANKAGCEVIQ